MRDDITFLSDGRKLVGHLYLPDTLVAGQALPAVVVIGASSGTKEQTPAVYGPRLAERGYAALTFDHTSYGQSEGMPRSDENPFAKSEDIKSAVSYLTGREEIDPSRIAADRRIKAVASVSGLPDLRGTLTSGFGGDWHDLMTFAQSAREG